MKLSPKAGQSQGGETRVLEWVLAPIREPSLWLCLGHRHSKWKYFPLWSLPPCSNSLQHMSGRESIWRAGLRGLRESGAAAAAKSLQSCPTLRNPMDCSLPGSSVHGIFQARVLEWGAIAFRKSGAAAPKFQRMLAFSQTSECDSSKIQIFSNHQVSVPYLVTNTGHVCVNK